MASSPLRTRLAYVALFALLAAVLVLGWRIQQRRERRAIDARVQQGAMLGAARLTDFFAERLEEIEDLARDLGRLGDVDEQTFRDRSRGLQAAHAGLQALNWIAPEGTILWVEPAATNRGVAGFDLDRHPVAAPAFRAAREADDLAVTPPLELLQGGWGLVTYVRVRSDRSLLGFLNGVFRLPDLLAECLTDRGLVYLLHHESDLIGALGPPPEVIGELPAASRPVDVGGRELTLTAVLTPTLGGASNTWTDELLLGAAIVLAGLLAWMVHVACDRQRKAELAADRLWVLVDNAPDAIVAIDVDSGCFAHGNQRARRLFGVDEKRLLELGPGELSPDVQPDGRPSRATYAELLQRALDGETPSFEWVHVDARGRRILTETQLVRLPSPPGRSLVRGSITDITERRELEKRVRSAQAHEAMGQLAGGVAHDFNNLLTGILGSIELLASRLRGDPQAEQLAREASQACQRAGELTRQLLAFSRHSVVKPTVIDLNAVVQGLLPMLGRLLGERVRLQVELHPGPAPILADPSQVEMVVLNLAINARDAMPGGGRITIATGDRDTDVVLTVRDEGEGIAPENLERIFHPFFTTKAPGVGTGIGLATVRQIVEQAQGQVDVESEPGRGATFRVRFPRAEGEPAEIAAPLPREVAAGAGVVLLVEDDEIVRSVARRAFERAGYQVLVASDGEQALELAAAHEGPIHLLVTDVVLPGLSGPELVRRLQQERPGLATLLVSGYAESQLDANGLSEGPLQLLRKPFTPSALTERARELLARGSPRS